MSENQRGLVYLIIGGCGFRGQHLLRILLEKEDRLEEIRVFDKRVDPTLNDLSTERTRVVVIQGDITDYKSVLEASHGTDVVIHTASLVVVWYKVPQPLIFVNVTGTKNVIKACVECGIECLYTSSMEVVGPNINGDHFKRKELQEALCRYTTDTLTHIHTVRAFCEMFSKWMLGRDTEVKMMRDIKDRLEALDLKSMMNLNVDSKRAELVEVLKDTASGLESLSSFLDAVEKLAVTSLHVFTENQVLHLPEGISPEYVQAVIMAARVICPLLLEFKRDDNAFFLPKLQNVEVLAYQLDRYIQTSKTICEKLDISCSSDFGLKMAVETVVDLDVDLSEDDIQRMLDHVNQLDEIRMNEQFRMVFLFQEEPCHGFISEFDKRRPTMLQFLKELEKTAVQLDRMNMGAKISSVAGSSVGAVGGVLYIVGLALSPFTAGVSLALTMTGLGLGITSGVNSIVTTATEIGVNATQQMKASEVFKNFVEDVQSLQSVLEEVTSQTIAKLDPFDINMFVGFRKIAAKVYTTKNKIDKLVDLASAGEMLQPEKGQALRNAPRVASDIPDIGQAAAKGTLALSKSARAGLIAVNALFLGMDIFFICKDSISLAKGSETEVSQFIRARAALWSSEIDSWQKLRDSLNEGLPTSEKKKAVLETPIYLEMEVKKQSEAERVEPPAE